MPYIHDLLTPNHKGTYPKLLHFSLSAEVFLPLPYTFTHTTPSLHTHFSSIYPKFGFSTVYPRMVLPSFLYNQRYITLFLPILLSAEGFLDNYEPVFSQILHLLLSHSDSTAYPQLLHGILSTAYPRITSISPRLF